MTGTSNTVLNQRDGVMPNVLISVFHTIRRPVSRTMPLQFFSIPSVGPAARVVAQQNTESLPQEPHVCLTSSLHLNPTPVVVMTDLQPGQ